MPHFYVDYHIITKKLIHLVLTGEKKNVMGLGIIFYCYDCMYKLIMVLKLNVQCFTIVIGHSLFVLH